MYNLWQQDPGKEATLAALVFAWLTEQIVTGNLRPGQWISENEIAEQLGVSRTPVREALRSFAQEGLVQTKRRRGTILAELDAAEIDDLYRTRALIEPEMHRLVIEHMTEEAVERASAIARDMREALGDPNASYHAHDHFRQLLMDVCPRRTVSDIVAMLWRRSLRVRGISLRMSGGDQQEALLGVVERFVEFARTGDAEGARASLAENLDLIRTALLEQLFVDVGDGTRMPRSATGQRAASL